LHAIVFCGIQGAGKSSFYRARFVDTHVRINLDMLRTRNRERLLFEACVAARQPFVVDNTNPSAADRRRYIVPAAAAGFDVVGYYFCASVQEGLVMNAGRERQVPPKAVVDTAKQLELPRLDEGFTALFSVRMDGNGGFSVEAWDGMGLAG